MRQKSGLVRSPAEHVVKDIRRATRRHFSAEEKIRVVLGGLRGEESIAELCRCPSSEFLGQRAGHLREALARLVVDVMRLADDAASVGFGMSVV
jgi:transposase